MAFQPSPNVATTLQGLDTDAQAFIQTLLEAAQRPTQSTPLLLKPAKPETYQGLRDPSALTPEAWIFQMRQYLEVYNQNLDHAVPFAATFLRGNALLWWRNLANQAPQTWNAFATALTKEFQPIDAIRGARNQLSDLTQTRSVAEYTAAFRILALAIPDLSPAEALHRYIFNLKPRTRLEVEIRNPTTLEEATHIANLYDTVAFSSKSTHQPFSNTHQMSTMPSPSHANSPTTIAPMDLSAATAPRPTRRLTRLTPTEYDQLRATGSCFRCRQAGHMAQNCPIYRNQANLLVTRPANIIESNSENTLPQ